MRKGNGGEMAAVMDASLAEENAEAEEMALLMKHVQEGRSDIEISFLRSSPYNPRQHFNQTKLEELAASIKLDGVAQGLVVRPQRKNKDIWYEIVAGERRFRAAKIAGLEKLPCDVRFMDDAAALRICGIENLQREDLNALEEARWFKAMLERGAYADTKALAAAAGKSLRYVQQQLQLNTLIKAVQDALLADEINASHASLLCRLQPPDQKRALEYFRSQIEIEIDGGKRREIQVGLSCRALELWINNQVYCDLSRVPWALEDATFKTRNGPCSTCPFRARNNQDLFTEPNGRDTCTSPECFQAKRLETAEREAARIKQETGRKPVLISVDARNCPMKGAQAYWAVSEAKEGDKNAVPALFVDGEKCGKRTWVEVQRDQKSVKPETPAERKEREQRQREKEVKERALEKQACAELKAVIDAVDGPLSRENFAAMLKEVWDAAGWRSEEIVKGCGEKIGRKDIVKMTDRALHRLQLMLFLSRGMDYRGVISIQGEIEAWAARLGVDLAGMRGSLAEEHGISGRAIRAAIKAAKGKRLKVGGKKRK